jgi:hypothetical protein
MARGGQQGFGKDDSCTYYSVLFHRGLFRFVLELTTARLEDSKLKLSAFSSIDSPLFTP